MSIEVGAAAEQPSGVTEQSLPRIDLSIQKLAVFMYRDEKLLFYDLFIKGFIKN